MPEAFISTSWDDGASADLRIAELLSKYEIPGCFYVPRTNPERSVIGEHALKELARAHEVGGHTLRHLSLTSLSDADARAEIHGCKAWLDDLLGQETRSFCYPQGKFSSVHAREVAAAGFTCARTADWLCLSPSSDVFRIAPALHLYPHSPLVNVAHCLRRNHPRALARYLLRFRARSRPSQLAEAMLDHIELHGGVFHVWGHGWEIEEHGLWAELEAILRSISRRPGLTRLDNAALGARLKDRSWKTSD